VALQNLKIAIRVLLRSPLFTLTAVVTIALGIGASTAIFSVTNAVLLQPLPYKDADRLVFAGMELRRRHVRDLPFSNADYIDLREGTKNAFEDYAGVFTFPQVILHDNGTPEEVKFAITTTNFFRMLGGRMVVGRDFQEEDGAPQPAAAPGAPPAERKPVYRRAQLRIFSAWLWREHRHSGTSDARQRWSKPDRGRRAGSEFPVVFSSGSKRGSCAGHMDCQSS
jgi:MacB-like periplasmic core domain